MIERTVTIQAKPLADAVKWVARFLDARPAVPIQGGLMLTAEGGQLSIVGMNEVATVRAAVPVEGGGDGQVIVSGRLLAELVATFAGKNVTIGTEDGVLVLAGGRARVTLPAMEGLFSAPPEAPPTIGKVPGAALATAVKRAAAARAISDKQPPVLHCLALAFGEGLVSATATDTLRAATAAAPYSGQPGHALADAQAVLDVAETLAGSDDVWIALNDSLIGFATPDRAVLMRQVKGEGKKGFPTPEVAKLFVAADAQPDHARLNVSDLAVPIKQAVLVQDRERPVRFGFSAGAVSISGQSHELKQGSAGEIDADYDGESCSFLINPKYLALATASAPSEHLVLTFDAARTNTSGRPSPILLTSEADPTWRHAIMPVRPLTN